MQMQAKEVPELLTIAEAGQRLRVGREKVTELIRDGQLKAFRLGRRCVRIHADSVQKLVEGL